MEGLEFRLERGALGDLLVVSGAAGEAARMRVWQPRAELVVAGRLLRVTREGRRGCAVRCGADVVWASDLLLAKDRSRFSVAAAVLVAVVAATVAGAVAIALARAPWSQGLVVAAGLLVATASGVALFLTVVACRRSGLTAELSSARDEVTVRARPWHRRCSTFSLRSDVEAVYAFPAPDRPSELTLALLVGRPHLVLLLLPLRGGEEALAAVDWHLRRGRGFPAGRATHAQHLATCAAMAQRHNRALRGDEGPEQTFAKSEEDALAIAVAQIEDLEQNQNPERPHDQDELEANAAESLNSNPEGSNEPLLEAVEM